MTISVIKKKLHEFIDSAEDKKAVPLYELLMEEQDHSLQRKKLIMQERENYLKGKGKSFSWQDVKEMAVN